MSKTKPTKHVEIKSSFMEFKGDVTEFKATKLMKLAKKLQIQSMPKRKFYEHKDHYMNRKDVQNWMKDNKKQLTCQIKPV